MGCLPLTCGCCWMVCLSSNGTACCWLEGMRSEPMRSCTVRLRTWTLPPGTTPRCRRSPRVSSLRSKRAGYGVRLVEAASLRYARLVLRLPDSGEELEMDLLKEALGPRWVTVQITPAASVRAVSFEDTVGLKARAWHDRFVVRDIIDLHAVAGTFSYADLENLARRHDPDLDLEMIQDHLAGVSVFADEDFAEYGLDEPRIADLRNWVTGWYDNLASRLAAELVDDEMPDDL